MRLSLILLTLCILIVSCSPNTGSVSQTPQVSSATTQVLSSTDPFLKGPMTTVAVQTRTTEGGGASPNGQCPGCILPTPNPRPSTVALDVRNYMIQPLNGQMLCDQSSTICLTSYSDANGEYNNQYNSYNNIHDYTVTSSDSIAVIRSYDPVNGVRCYSNVGGPCVSPWNDTAAPEDMPYMLNVNVVSASALAAASNSNGGPMTAITGSLNVANGQLGNAYMDQTTCAQSYYGSAPYNVNVAYVRSFPFGGNVGTQDMLVVDEFESGPTQSQNHMERYYYVHGYGRVAEGSATYDTSTGVYDINSGYNNRPYLSTNTIPINASMCPQG